MQRTIMIVIVLMGLLFMTGSQSQVAAAPESCNVPLAWGDARSVLETELKLEFVRPPWFTNSLPGRPSTPITVFVVLFQAQDGTVRVVSAHNCTALATLTRN